MTNLITLHVRAPPIAQLAIGSKPQAFVGLHRSQPTLPFFRDDLPQRLDPARMIVQTRAGVQCFTAGLAKDRARFVADLVQRLQTIGREPRHGDEYAAYT